MNTAFSKDTIEIKKLPTVRVCITGFIMLSIAALLIYIVATVVLQKIHGNIKYLPAGIAFLIVVSSFYNFFRGVTEKIILNKTTLSYKRGFKTRVIAVKDIKEVEVVDNISSGFAVRNIIMRMISDALMGKFQLHIALTNGEEILIPTVAGGGNLISPNIGFSNKYAEKAKQEIDSYLNPNNSLKQTVTKEKISYDVYDKLIFKNVFEKYLISIQNEPIEIHKVAKNYNWDHGHDTLFWMIRNPNTDKATALSLYWLGQPKEFTEYKSRQEVEEDQLNNYDFLMELEKNYRENFYKSGQISYDPKNDMGTDWTESENSSNKARPIPEVMYNSLEGSINHNDMKDYLELEEGFPKKVWDETTEFDNKYEVS